MLHKLLLAAYLAYVGSASFAGWYSVVDTEENQRVAICQGEDGVHYWALHDHCKDAFRDVPAVGSGVEGEDGVVSSDEDNVVLTVGFNEEGDFVYFDDKVATLSYDEEGNLQLTIGEDVYPLKAMMDDEDEDAYMMASDEECWKPSDGDAFALPAYLRSDERQKGAQGAYEYAYFSEGDSCWAQYRMSQDEFLGGGLYVDLTYYMDGKRYAAIFYDDAVEECHLGPEIGTQYSDTGLVLSWYCNDGESPLQTSYLHSLVEGFPFDFDGCPMF